MRTPVESMLIRLMIGCVQPLVTPGICIFALSSAMMSALRMPGRHWSRGFSMISVSIMLMGELSVAVFARPALPSTWSTSGTEVINLSCTCRIRLISVLEMSGNVTGMKRIEPSSKGGMNSVPKRVSMKPPMASATMLIAKVVRRQCMHHRSTGA